MTVEPDSAVVSDQEAVSLSAADAAAFVYRENRLLDSMALEEWHSLFAADGRYWLPIADGPLESAASEISIIYDDAAGLAERIFRTLKTPVLDQSPRSRTVHLSSNIEVLPGEDAAEVRVLCNTLVSEIRLGGSLQVGLNEARILAARCEYRLRKEGAEWRIGLKKVLLLDSEQPLYNLSFLL